MAGTVAVSALGTVPTTLVGVGVTTFPPGFDVEQPAENASSGSRIASGARRRTGGILSQPFEVEAGLTPRRQLGSPLYTTRHETPLVRTRFRPHDPHARHHGDARTPLRPLRCGADHLGRRRARADARDHRRHLALPVLHLRQARAA